MSGSWQSNPQNSRPSPEGSQVLLLCLQVGYPCPGVLLLESTYEKLYKKKTRFFQVALVVKATKLRLI